MAASTNTRKRPFEDFDDEPNPRLNTKVLKLDLPQPASFSQPSPQPRILPFRASPTSKHSLSFSQCTRTRPSAIISASGALTPESSEDEGKPRGFFLPTPPELDLQTPPRTKSSSKPNFDAFCTIRDVVDIDTDMADSPAPSSFAMSSPVSPHSKPPSQMILAMPPSPKPSRFKLQPPPRPDQIIGGRIPTPTYGHFRLNDSDVEISPKTRQKGSFIRRDACPPSPISEDEFESPSFIAGGLLGKLNIGTPGISRRRHMESSLRSRLRRINEGEAGIRTSWQAGYRTMGRIGEVEATS